MSRASQWTADPAMQAVTGRASGPPGTSPAADLHSDDDPPSGVAYRFDLLDAVPRLAISRAELMRLPLDHREGFIVSFVDGAYTVDMILDACAMGRDLAMRLLLDLAARGVIAFG